MPNSTAASTSATKSSQHTLETCRPLLKQLILSLPVPGVPVLPHRPLPPPLSPTQLSSLFSHLADPEYSSNSANQAQLGAVLSGLRLGGVDTRAETLSIVTEIFLRRSIPVDSQDGLARERNAAEAKRRIEEQGWTDLLDWEPERGYDGTLDLVGTGGDGQDTFNVSTTAAIVASGVPGVRICKHGAKASSSTSGSADLLLSLGIPLLSLSPSIISSILPTSPFTFLFAQLFHPALAPLGPIRRALGHPTIFNVLGPLINPAKPRRCILGVHSAYLGQIFAEALRQRGCERAWIVCGREGLDEISIEGETDVWSLESGQITHLVVSPSSFGLDSHPLSTVASHSSKENAAIVLHLLQLSQEEAQSLPTEPLSSPLQVQPTDSVDAATHALLTTSLLPTIPAGTDLRAILDYTLLQSAALLYIGGYASSLPRATALARHSITSRGALTALERFRSLAVDGVQREKEKVEEEAEEQTRLMDLERSREQRRREKDVGDAVDQKRDEFFYAPEPSRSIGVGTSD